MLENPEPGSRGEGSAGERGEQAQQNDAAWVSHVGLSPSKGKRSRPLA
jgi:hypothetical protein